LINRLPEESVFEYGLRLIEAKMEGSGDIEWQDIVDILHLDIHRDTLRKACQGEYGSYNVLKYFRNKAVEDSGSEEDGSEVLDILNLKLLEIEKERKKRQTISIEYNKMLREQARHELLIEKVRDIIPTLEVPDFYPLKDSKKDQEWILSFADIHFDKHFESVNNAYSIEEVYRRFNKLSGKVIAKIERENISHLTILNLGDSIEGLLRIGALASMKIGMVESVIAFSRFMAKWLNDLSKYVTITYRHVETANHSEIRLFNQKRGETDENLEKLMLCYIHDVLQDNERVEVVIENANHIKFKVFDYEILAIHGDAVKSPDSSLSNFSMLHRRFYDYIFMGHFHSDMNKTKFEGEDNNRKIIVVPSMVGSDTYSDSLFVGSKASAEMYGFTKGEGLTDVKTFIVN